MRYYFIPIRMAIIQKKNLSVGEDVEKLEPLCTAHGKAKWCSRCGKSRGNSSKKLMYNYHMMP